MLLSKRPITQIGKTEIPPQSLKEEPLRFIAIVTEGSVEELVYLKGFEMELRRKSGNNVTIYFLNDYIREEILAKEEKASHPKRRLMLMKELLSQKNPDFTQYPDEAWLVCDRDEQSFSESQYNDVLKECKDYNINLIISNPAFQIWLLFHFDAWLREYFYEDGLVGTDKLKLIEKRLKRVLPYYKHGAMNFTLFAQKVGNAMVNSRKYCVNCVELRDEIGTNFADLLQSLCRFFL